MTTPNQEDLLKNPPKTEAVSTQPEAETVEVAVEETGDLVEKKQEKSLEGQVAMVKESLDSIKGSFVNWKQAILDSKFFADDELPGVEQWFSDSLNRFQSIEQIITSELEVLQILRKGRTEQSNGIQKISERLFNVNKVLKDQQEKISSLLASVRLINEGLSQNPQAAKDSVVSSMRIVFKAMNELSQKYFSSMDVNALKDDLSEEELLLKSNDPEQFKVKMKEKEDNLNLLYNCYDQKRFFGEIETDFVFRDVYFEKEGLFLSARENETLQSLILANGDLEKTRLDTTKVPPTVRPLISENLRQFHTLKAVIDDNGETYKILGQNFTALEYVNKILAATKMVALDNYDLKQYTLSAFQANIGRLLSEDKAAEIPAYLEKNLNDLINMLSALLKLPVSDVSNYLNTNVAELKKLVEEVEAEQAKVEQVEKGAKEFAVGELGSASGEDFPVPKMESVVLEDTSVTSEPVKSEAAPVQEELSVEPMAPLPAMESLEKKEAEEFLDADDLLEEVPDDQKVKYEMPSLPGKKSLEQTQVLENFWKGEETFKQEINRGIDTDVLFYVNLIKGFKSVLAKNGVTEVEGVSLSELPVDQLAFKDEVLSDISNLIIAELSKQTAVAEIKTQISDYVKEKRDELLSINRKLQQAVAPFVESTMKAEKPNPVAEFWKKHPDIKSLVESNVDSKLVSKVQSIATLVENQFLKENIKQVAGIDLLALKEIYDPVAASQEFKDEVATIVERELAKGSSPEKVQSLLDQFITTTNDKLRNLYQLLSENIPRRVVEGDLNSILAELRRERETKKNMASEFLTNHPVLSQRLHYYQTMFDELKESFDSKFGVGSADNYSEAFSNKVNRIVNESLSQNKSEEDVEKLIMDEFDFVENILNVLSADLVKKNIQAKKSESVDIKEQVPFKSTDRKMENRELPLTKMIVEAKSFDDLVKVIEDNQISLVGSDKETVYSTKQLLDIILKGKEAAQKGLVPQYSDATRSHKFRNKLYELHNEQRAKKLDTEEKIEEISDADIIESQPIEPEPILLTKDMMKKPAEPEIISLTEDMKKKPEKAKVLDWRQEAIIGPHERMLELSAIIKGLSRPEDSSERYNLIGILDKFNYLSESLDNPSVLATWDQFRVENNIETEDPLVYFLDKKILDLNAILLAHKQKNAFDFMNSVGPAAVRVSNFMNALGLAEGLPSTGGSVDARNSLKSGGGIKFQMPGSL
jgi:hypothetical protein